MQVWDACTRTDMWGPENNLRCCASGATFLHWGIVSHWPGAHEAARLAGHRAQGFARLCLPRITSASHHTLNFILDSREQTQGFVPERQVLYIRSYLPSLRVDYHCMSNAICLQNETILLGHIPKSYSVDLGKRQERKWHTSSKEKAVLECILCSNHTHSRGLAIHSRLT